LTFPQAAAFIIPGMPNQVPSPRQTVLIVDDHPVLRRGLTDVINQEPDLMVCGTATTCSAGRTAVAKWKPDLMILDLALGTENGLELIKELHHADRKLRMLALSMYDEKLYAERVLRAGARGYIAKAEPIPELLSAIRRVLGGETYLSPTMTRRLLSTMAPRAKPADTGLAKLSDREFAVLELLGKGLSPKAICQRLHVSAETISSHYRRLRDKLGLRSAVEMRRFAEQCFANGGGRIVRRRRGR
jgi:DNA-binding NarL/FixJ family response regulator